MFLQDKIKVKSKMGVRMGLANVVARVESLRWRMGESTRQVEGLFESVLSEAFS